MWEDVEKRGERYLELKRLIEDPASGGDSRYASWLREYGRLTAFGELYASWKKAETDVKESEAILADASADADLKELAQEELGTARATAAKLKEELFDQVITAAELEEADRNVIFELYAGVGGDEAALFVGDLFNMYQRFVEKHPAWKMTVLNSSPSDMGGLKDVSFRVEGPGAFGDLRFEGGGHRVQRVPKTETQGRIHTSMARVAVLPEAEEVDVKIDPKEVEIKFCGAGGPGGQNVNKVATQCQLLHLPSGIQVRCMETRSQRQNEARAWQILRSKLFALEKAKADKTRSDQRLGQIGSGDRSERIRTYNFPQGRCTDHRLEGEDKNWPIQDIVGGNLDGLIGKLKDARRRAGLGATLSASDSE